ncbi:Uncharacterised protein [Klebsiella pneumoniae]|nr:Uncharacterised protein [Klebsiella pneumoniae]SLO44080.1 Uncharacterised protein [Klebsiella pneumoniae]VAQ38977.1 Uncharacterised protein [Klebsiella pneumoniae]
MTLRIALLIDALLTEGVEIRQVGNRFARLLIQIAHPAFLGTALGKLLFDAQTLCQFAGHLIDGFAFKARLDGLIGKDNVGHVAAGGIQREIHLLGGGTVRQQNISVFRRGGHMAVNDHNHLAFLVVLQDFVGPVDLRMLVNQTVARIVPDHFDRHVELIFTAYAVAQSGHFRAALNRIGPHKHRDTGLNRILQRRHTLKRQTIRALARPAIAAVDPDVTRQNGEH